MLCRNTCTLHGSYSALKHDQSSAILAKQLRFNHSARGLTFNTHDQSAVKMMAVVVSLFFTCYGIYLRCDFVLLFFHEASCNDVRYKIPIFVSNSAVNPFTYAFFKRDIKKEIKKLVCRTTFKKGNRIQPIDRSNSCSNIWNVLRWTFFDPIVHDKLSYAVKKLDSGYITVVKPLEYVAYYWTETMLRVLK